jgi:hypothetical protein
MSTNIQAQEVCQTVTVAVTILDYLYYSLF